MLYEVITVASAITPAGLTRTLQILHGDLQRQFGLPHPRILVCGLNPHAGEGGHLGREEIEIIGPVLEQLRLQGMELLGPLPADTLFQEKYLQRTDAVLAMYHDQGLPVLNRITSYNVCYTKLLRLITSSRMPAAASFSIWCWMRGLPPTHSSGLGQASVRGRMRSPRPAARIMARLAVPPVD